MAEQKKSDTITIKKDQLWKYSTFILAGIIVLGLVFLLIPGKSGMPTPNVVAPPELPPTTAQLTVSADDHFLIGSPDSDVIIVEYSDFQCPFCQRAYGDAVAQIKAKYGASGDVAMIYRQFPLNSIHPQAQISAEASECANEQGKFLEMHNMMFESGVTGGAAALKGYAAQIGLDTAQFNDCLDSGKYRSEVQSDVSEGTSVGVRGTPAFFVGNEDDGFTLVSGAQPFTVFDQLIQAQLG